VYSILSSFVQFSSSNGSRTLFGRCYWSQKILTTGNIESELESRSKNLTHSTASVAVYAILIVPLTQVLKVCKFIQKDILRTFTGMDQEYGLYRMPDLNEPVYGDFQIPSGTNYEIDYNIISKVSTYYPFNFTFFRARIRWCGISIV
jgi:hypothetical protein